MADGSAPRPALSPETMAVTSAVPPIDGWRNRLAASPRFQSWASRMPVLRRIAKGEGEALMDLISGFVQSQVLSALIELEVLEALAPGPQRIDTLAQVTGLSDARMGALARAGIALRLMTRRRDGRIALAQSGASLLGVPGLRQMIRHHRVLYGDLSDPVAVLRGVADTDLARFWPYVFGAAPGTVAPEIAESYSQLMADSQALVAEETLRTVSFRDSTCLMDVGGGTGAFLSAALAATPGLKGVLFDLPPVVPVARARFASRGLSERVSIAPGSFRDAPLPAVADTISLVRVLYDHADTTVAMLLERVRRALPPGGRLVISEPMSGGDRPTRSGDVYFAFYCMAMRTGRVRSAAEIAAACRTAGFVKVSTPRTARPFLTSVVTAVNPA